MSEESKMNKEEQGESGQRVEPPDVSLEEQIQGEPARDMSSQTDDFETNATVDGYYTPQSSPADSR